LGNDIFYGGNGNDFIYGWTGNETYYGEAGNDTLLGSSGNDSLVGGAGTDSMTGGSGFNDFRFLNVTDSNAGISRDRITDFVTGVDDIDLSSIDSNLSLAGDQAFSFIGLGAFSVLGNGEVRYYQFGGSTVIQVDRQGDGDVSAEMEIILTGSINLVAGDFIL
jgi:Ca2+-binding RTX toxin-like protein